MPVAIWHGELDNSTPIGMARGMADCIPGARLSILPGQGHLFVYGPCWRSILQALAACDPQSADRPRGRPEFPDWP